MKNVVFSFLFFALACTQPAPAPQPAPPVQQEPVAAVTIAGFTEAMNQADKLTTQLPDGTLEMAAGKETDFFIEPGVPPYDMANAPLLLRTVDNTQPFTFSFKTTPAHAVKYDAGMAFLYVDHQHWLKFAFEADERMNTRIVTVRTNGTSDDNNHDAVKSPFVYLKISSDTKAIAFYYSTDNQAWQLVRVFKNDFPAALRLGIGSQSPAGPGCKSVFSDIQLTNAAVKDFRMGI